MERRNALMICGAVVALAAVLALTAIGMRHELAVNDCLDRGGRCDHRRNDCELPTPASSAPRLP